MAALIFAVGFDDQLPCARNKWNFGIGCTLFACESEAVEFKGGSLYSVASFNVRGDGAAVAAIIAKHEKAQARHAASLQAN